MGQLSVPLDALDVTDLQVILDPPWGSFWWEGSDVSKGKGERVGQQ